MNKQLFGFDCPGCGMQRSLALILKGQFADAFFMFPAIYTLVVFFGFIALHFLDKKRNYHKIIISLGIINGLIMIISYIYKILINN
ncbi:hypothetical protein J2X31_001248 [Flavobacterium arsenatis]|uniref:DUF2752 domain-containing protein n=1 Tax=Flavobacterium arsenatis TaxID=1484332 RepID=A0ABU1TN00_9FLAO|nr:DUF2752 domain-containing protein [Flavobacterium arsenatis]MDR6967241.1 hypothetical protein [Flavobacterium arsenatis]